MGGMRKSNFIDLTRPFYFDKNISSSSGGGEERTDSMSSSRYFREFPNRNLVKQQKDSDEVHQTDKIYRSNLDKFMESAIYDPTQTAFTVLMY